MSIVVPNHLSKKPLTDGFACYGGGGVGLRGEVPQDDANNPPLEGEGCTPQKILFLSAAKSQERIKFPLQFNARRACFFGGIATSLSD